MKFGKITSAKVSQNALSLGGAVGGGALSGGLMTLVPAEQKTLARAGVTGLSLLGAASLNPKTSAETLVQFALIGMAIRQSSELIKEFANKEIQVTPESTTSEKFVAGMAGLACPCEDTTMPALASPIIDFAALNPVKQPVLNEFNQTEEVVEVSSNIF